MLPRRERELERVKVLFGVVGVAQRVEAGGVGGGRAGEAGAGWLRVRRRGVDAAAVLQAAASNGKRHRQKRTATSD